MAAPATGDKTADLVLSLSVFFDSKVRVSMKKSLWVLALLLTAVLLLLAGLPYYLGIKAEQSLQEQQALLAKTSFLQVEQHDYQRGWFSSTETTVVRFKPSFLASVQKQLPDTIQTILREPITLVSHVRHGLFAGSLKPVRAQVDTELRFSPEADKILMRFFGQQKPATLHNTIYLSGSGNMTLEIPAFDYEELSGIKLAWQGLQSQMDYSAGFSSYDTHTTNPGLRMILADKGEAAYTGLDIRTHTQDGNNQIALGNSRLQLKQLSLQWHEGVSYDLKLNELVNLLTDLQIGAFINPNGSVPPSKIVLDELSFATDMSEEGQWINSQGQFGFAKLHYGNDVYGPLEIKASAEHLDAASLLALKHKLTELASQNLDETALQDAIVQAARTEGLGLFTQSPLIKLETFRFQMPEGLVDVHGQVRFNGLTADDMQHANSMLRKTEATMDLSVPQKLLEELAVRQARNIFTVDESAGGEEALIDINNTIRLMVSSTIKTMQQDGYLNVNNNGAVSTQINIHQNELTLNGKKFAAEPEPEWESETASAPAVATSASAASATP